MGFDLYGKSPTAPEGEYFRRNVWGWHPLAQYVQRVAPAITAPCEYWHTNEGDGLRAYNASRLAILLEDELIFGNAERYVAKRDAELATIPDEVCNLCHGTGIRNDEHVKGKCNKCEGRGTVRPFDTWYSLDVDDIREFAAFLKTCGGFKIC